MSDTTLDLDKHRGMAAQKATDIRRILLEVQNNAKELRDRQAILENQLLSVPAAYSISGTSAESIQVCGGYLAGARMRNGATSANVPGSNPSPLGGVCYI